VTVNVHLQCNYFPHRGQVREHESLEAFAQQHQFARGLSSPAAKCAVHTPEEHSGASRGMASIPVEEEGNRKASSCEVLMLSSSSNAFLWIVGGE
jgi:hypothetical protein